MKCDDIQQSLSLYVEDGLTAGVRLACYQHLEVCPVCRDHVVELRKLRSGLAMLPKPAPPADCPTLLAIVTSTQIGTEFW